MKGGCGDGMSGANGSRVEEVGLCDVVEMGMELVFMEHVLEFIFDFFVKTKNLPKLTFYPNF